MDNDSEWVVNLWKMIIAPDGLDDATREMRVNRHKEKKEARQRNFERYRARAWRRHIKAIQHGWEPTSLAGSTGAAACQFAPERSTRVMRTPLMDNTPGWFDNLVRAYEDEQ